MKRKVLSIILIVTFCMGFSVPTMAANVVDIPFISSLSGDYQLIYTVNSERIKEEIGYIETGEPILIIPKNGASDNGRYEINYAGNSKAVSSGDPYEFETGISLNVSGNLARSSSSEKIRVVSFVPPVEGHTGEIIWGEPYIGFFDYFNYLRGDRFYIAFVDQNLPIDVNNGYTGELGTQYRFKLPAGTNTGAYTVQATINAVVGKPEWIVGEEGDGYYNAKWEKSTVDVIVTEQTWDEYVAAWNVSISIPIAGDVDGNGELTTADLVCLAQHIAEIKTITNESSLKAADINGDDKINIIDLILLSQLLVKNP